MKLSISEDLKAGILSDLQTHNRAFQETYPSDRADRQPIHTVYGGANLFDAGIGAKLGRGALKSLEAYAPNFCVLGRVLKLEGWEHLPQSVGDIEVLEDRLDNLSEEERKKETHWLAYTVYNKLIQKLESEPVEDFRIDFEDGFGNRSDEEEDATAVRAAEEVARGMKEGLLTPFIGIRIKPFTEDLKRRGIRTLDIFVSTLVGLTGGKLPENFVVMLPKVTIPFQVESLVKLFEILEKANGMEAGSLKMEMMVETTQAIMNEDGKNPLMDFVKAGKGRLIACHFGTYDYTASCNITAKYQTMDHPVCDFAHHVTKVALSHTGIWLSDGATNVMPVGPHRGENLSFGELEENTKTVHRAWKMGYDHVRHSLWNGFYQGWDLHPAQLVVRYAAVYAFFLESYADAAARLTNFVEKAARATLTTDIFDDAATGQGLLNYFLKGMNSGAISLEEAMATGLTLEEIQSRSFYRILEGRRNA
ncbi:MAG: phosphoenolpyruvate kinase [Aureispira sp.]|nr:phosphoenolpyruvate kinase [Aureispira sp.]